MKPEIRLKIYRSPTEFRAETYRQPRVTVGREINNDICIAEKDVSRFHCMFECDEQSWRVVDLESTNGTYVNGICVKKTPLKNGDVIVVGATRLHVLECPAGTALVADAVGGCRVLQTFDARGIVHGSPHRRAKSRDSQAEEPKRGETAPIPQFPRALAPVLTAGEILEGVKDPRATAEAVAGRLLPLVEADSCVVYLSDPETGNLDRAVVEPDGEDIMVPADVLDYVREQKVAVHVEVDKHNLDRVGMHAVMCAPMLEGRRLLGIIALVRREAPWSFGDPDLELLSIAALSSGAALSCAHAYGQLERSYLDVLEASDSLPASVADGQQADAERVLVDSVVENLREKLARILEKSALLQKEVSQSESSKDLVAQMTAAARQSTRLADRLSRLIHQARDARGETWPVDVLAQLLPVLRDVAGPTMPINDRIATELPAVSVAPRVLHAALVRIVLFCRDHVRAVRLTLTAELHGFEEPGRVEGFEPIAAGDYVRISIEAEGDSTAIEDLAPLRDEEVGEPPRDPRSRVVGLYWSARMLRRAAGRMIVRGEGDQAIRFDLYLPLLS